MLCETACPLAIRDGCRDRMPYPRGVIVDGVAFDDQGREVPIDSPPPTPVARRRVANHHAEIERRRLVDKQSWGQIAIALGFSLSAVKDYGRSHIGQVSA